MDQIVYLDNAATSWPKPPEVRAALDEYFGMGGGNPGRSGHRMSIAAARIVEDARDEIAAILGVPDPTRVALTKNATEGLNMAIYGSLQPGDHAITSSIEHNSVMRPLRHLEAEGVDLTVVPCRPDGTLDPAATRDAIRPETRLIVTLHGSNVMGSLLPVGDIAGIARESGVPYLVDASQTAGSIPLDAPGLGVDMVAVTGHKGLLGPTGTGALWVRDGIDLPSFLRGGTGSRSDLEIQPEFMPDSLESGTLNVAGLAGLAAGIRYLRDRGIDSIARHERSLVARFLDGTGSLKGVTVYGPDAVDDRCGVISFDIDGLTCSEVGTLLDQRFGIMSRVGLHCAPGAHRTMGTFPTGTVRFGLSPFTTVEEIDFSLEAIAEIRDWAVANA